MRTERRDLSEEKSFSIFRKFKAEEPDEVLIRGKKYSKSYREETASVQNTSSFKPQGLSLFVDDRRIVEDIAESSNSPSKVTRRMLTQEFDREESPKRKEREKKDRIDESLFFCENTDIPNPSNIIKTQSIREIQIFDTENLPKTSLYKIKKSSTLDDRIEPRLDPHHLSKNSSNSKPKKSNITRDDTNLKQSDHLSKADPSIWKQGTSSTYLTNQDSEKNKSRFLLCSDTIIEGSPKAGSPQYS